MALGEVNSSTEGNPSVFKDKDTEDDWRRTAELPTCMTAEQKLALLTRRMRRLGGLTRCEDMVYNNLKSGGIVVTTGDYPRYVREDEVKSK